MQGGGAERVAALLCNHWVEQGHQVTLMPTFSGRGDCLYPLDERVQLDYLADRVGSRSRSALNKLRRYGALRRAIREIGPDVIISFLPHVNVAAVLSAWGLRIPVVVSERVHPPTMLLGWGLEALRRFAYPRAAHVIVQTGRALDWLQDCCPKARGRVIPNPVVYPLPAADPFQEPASVVDETRRVVLAVGRLDVQKGFDQLLAAFGGLAQRYPEWDLVILGEGPERGRLEAQRDGLGLSGLVHLPGRAGNPGDWYARADLYVMSSRFEGFPNALVEAMAHGLPAVSFDCETGPADIIREGVDGYLVPPAEGAEGLARAMETLMGDDEKRHGTGKAAVAVRKRFAPERVMAAWDEVLGLREENASV
jgi:glycosyltransferase involved in cell wall biosynthesis